MRKRTPFIVDCSKVPSVSISIMTTVTITLRDEDQRFIESAMESGRYVTESEAVADAIAELRARENLHQSRIAELSAKVMVGMAQLDRGEGVEWNPEEIEAKGQALLASRKPANNDAPRGQIAYRAPSAISHKCAMGRCPVCS